MKNADPIVFVVDDDPSVRKATERLLKTAGLSVATFETAEQFLNHRHWDRPGCLILDLEMPGLGGIELQQELAARDVDIPIVFMTGHGDIPTSVTAIKRGAVDFLPKPVEPLVLVKTVQQAIAEHLQRQEKLAVVSRFQARVNLLTKREYEVMLLVITGMLNKQIANKLGITETTVKVHRGRVMQKTGVKALAELVRLCDQAGLPSEEHLV